MFIAPTSIRSKTQRRVLAASLLAHALLFAWLLHSPAPQLLNPNSVALGHNGNVTKLYFPTANPDDSNTSSAEQATQVYRHQRLAHEKLILNQKAIIARTAVPALIPPSSAEDHFKEDESKSATLSKLGHGELAGRTYGGAPGSPIYGDEIRPAIPIATVDPVVYPWQLPETEGNVVVEITIDERGEIVDKAVLHSMGSSLDEKFLTALKNWRFEPATRNGVAIASKQDAVFHFKAKGQA